MKKILSGILIFATLYVNTNTVLAKSNYIFTTTTTENYSASSPVGKFENSASNITALSSTNIINVEKDPNTNTLIVSTIPSSTTYAMPINTNSTADNDKMVYNQTYSSQDIQIPQSYTKTVTKTEQYVDTREKADKIIDRGLTLIGGIVGIGALALVAIGAVFNALPD